MSLEIYCHSLFLDGLPLRWNIVLTQFITYFNIWRYGISMQGNRRENLMPYYIKYLVEAMVYFRSQHPKSLSHMCRFPRQYHSSRRCRRDVKLIYRKKHECEVNREEIMLQLMRSFGFSRCYMCSQAYVRSLMQFPNRVLLFLVKS